MTDDATLAAALVALVYARHLGDPDGMAAMAGTVAARHDFGLTTSGSATAWMLPVEQHDRQTAWRIRGSLLDLETALAGLTLRRINSTEMPPEPAIAPQDRQTIALTVALFEASSLTDEGRDAIVAAIRGGRARVGALTMRSDLDGVSRDGGLSEWRRNALEWDLAHGGDATKAFSLLELLWLGSAGREMPAQWDAWGAAALPRSGCLCLTMPRPRPWEEDAGYTSAILGTRAADAALRTAEALAEFRLPATLAPALAGYTMQAVVEHARLARPDDWEEFGRAARELPREAIADVIAALAAGGPLVPVTKDENDRQDP